MSKQYVYLISYMFNRNGNYIFGQIRMDMPKKFQPDDIDLVLDEIKNKGGIDKDNNVIILSIYEF